VWDAAVETAPNAVEVYVGYLRRKIGRDRLQTVRGAGYRLVAAGDDRTSDRADGVMEA
jgi:two-component system, OmpR family, response regulator